MIKFGSRKTGSGTGPRRPGKHRRKAAAGAVTAAALAAAVLAAMPGTAIAATGSASAAAAAGGYCGVFGSGESGGYTMYGMEPVTIWTKQADTCHDFNLTWAGSAGDYAGLYMTSSGSWHVGSEGWVYHNRGHDLKVLLTDMAPGAQMTVENSEGSSTGHIDTVPVWVNY